MTSTDLPMRPTSLSVSARCVRGFKIKIEIVDVFTMAKLLWRFKAIHSRKAEKHPLSFIYVLAAFGQDIAQLSHQQLLLLHHIAAC